LFHAVKAPAEDSEAGFTIIEVLAALAIFALSIVAIGQVVSTNARGVRALEDHVALAQTTQAVFSAAIPLHEDLAPGRFSGSINDHRWQVDIGPFAARSVNDRVEAAWIPALVRVHVRSPSGATIELETVRLMRGPKR
jgi:general secretion pathway protein I